MRKLIISIVAFVLLTAAFSTTTIHIVGVSEKNGKYIGVVANLTVIKKPGSGRVFISTDPLAKVDTQASARLAHDVACNILNANCSKYDFYYIITSNAPLIGGPSAGAAMTIATMAELTNVSVYSDVAITGTITPYGDIGPVGGVYEKLGAAASFAKVFLVPSGETTVEINEGNTTKTINLVNYAQKEYGVKVIPVDDIYQAFQYMTGYEIKRPQTNVIKYNETGMKKIASSLINYAEQKKSELNTGGLSKSQSEKVSSIITEADKDLGNAQVQFSEGNYYSAASFAVGAITNYDYATNLFNLYTNKTGYFDDEVASIRSNLKVVKSTIQNANINSIEDIEAISISYDRMMDAYSYLDLANKEYYSGDKEKAMYYLAYADMRSISSYDWLYLLNYFNGNLSMSFNQQKLKPLAIEKIDLATTYTTYADILVSSQANFRAHEHLNSAISAYNSGDYLYAIFESTRALADSSISIEAPYILSNVNQSLDEFKIGTERTITRAEASGIIPIMAVNYLEYANTLENKDPMSAFIYYAYARNFAYLPQEIAKYEGMNIVYKNPVKIEKHYEISYETLQNTIWIQSLLAISGFLAGLTIAYWRLERKR